jgi:hypothetical protein
MIEGDRERAVRREVPRVERTVVRRDGMRDRIEVLPSDGVPDEHLESLGLKQLSGNGYASLSCARRCREHKQERHGGRGRAPHLATR